MFRHAGRLVLVLVLIWHMFSVAFYSIPRDAEDVFSKWTRLDVLPLISPYMYATSQWQLWNIFAPDPLRRVTSYRIEVKEDAQWKELITIGPDTFSVFRHATQMKLMGNILDEFKDNRAPLAGRFLHLLCTKHGVASDTAIRLMYTYYVLPQPAEPQSAAWWRAWQPRPESYPGFTTTCP
jgi:hypothetical protein